MRRRSRNHETRFAILKFIINFGIIIAIFHEEFWYYLRLLWLFISHLKTPLPELMTNELFDQELIVRYALNLLAGIVLYFFALLVFSLFNSQFLLPVYSAKERWQVFSRFINFMSGNHGPLMFVRDGQTISHIGESDKEGPGVVLVYSNNAVVAGDKVFGPGIVFTGEKQKVGMVMDLRKQFRKAKKVTAVTRDGIEISTDISIEFSISAPPQTIYITMGNHSGGKEDIQILELNSRGVVIKISKLGASSDELIEVYRTIHKLKAQDWDDLPFVDLNEYESSFYIPERVQASYASQPRSPSSGERIDWRELPLNIAKEELRNNIVKYPFDDLFVPTRPKEPESDQKAAKSSLTSSTTISSLKEANEKFYPLEEIRQNFSTKVRHSGFLCYIYVERRDGKRIQVGDHISPLKMIDYPPVLLQYPRPLRRSMITVSSVTFGEVTPTSEEVRSQTIDNLIARWNSEAVRTEVGFDEQAVLIRSRAKAQVQQDTVYALRDILRNSDKAKTALILRIFQALESATAGSDNKEMVSMVKMLGDLRDWFKYSKEDNPPGNPFDKGI